MELEKARYSVEKRREKRWTLVSAFLKRWDSEICTAEHQLLNHVVNKIY